MKMFKYDYVKEMCKELNKTLKEYIKESKDNFVVLDNDTPLVWENFVPAIYGGLEDAEITINNFFTEVNLDDEDDVPNFHIMDEWSFIHQYCFDFLEEIIREHIIKNGEDDGICKIFFLSDMNGVINYDNGLYTDILNVSVGIDNRVSILISDSEDMYQTFEDIAMLDSENIFKILMQLL